MPKVRKGLARRSLGEGGRNFGTPIEKRPTLLRLQRLSQMRFFPLEPPDRKNLPQVREFDGVRDEGGGEMLE